MSIREANTSRVLQNGSTSRDRDRNILKQSILRDFEKQSTYYECSKNGTLQGFQIVNNDKIDDVKTIITKPDEIINTGDVIEWNNDKWIIIYTELFNDIYWKGNIQQSNNTLKFYNKDNESGISWVLNEVPCIVSTPFKTGLGIVDGRVIASSKEEYEIILPDNNETKIIDIGHRFILNDKPFLCEGVQNLVPVGLKTLKFTIDKFVDDDNRNLGISNYYSHQSTDNPSNDEIVITPSISNIEIGKSITFSAKFYDNGIENDTIHFNWELSNTDGSNNIYAIINPNNKTCEIITSNTFISIGKSINIKISLVENPTRFIVKEYKIISLV